MYFIKISTVFLFFYCVISVQPLLAQFTSTWQTVDFAGSPYVQLPIDLRRGSGFPPPPVSYTIDWGDGTIETITSADDAPFHAYSVDGEYTITVTPIAGVNIVGFDNSQFLDPAFNASLRTIDDFGNTMWEDLSFEGMTGLTAINDIPDLSELTSASNMFSGASSFNSDVSGWDVSTITDMSGMFQGASSFDQNLGDWDISSVTNMNNIVSGTSVSSNNIDLTLTGWSTQNVQSGITFDDNGAGHCGSVAPPRDAIAAKVELEGKGWTINSALTDANCPSGSPLPVELLTFEATVSSDNLVSLFWSTATETNNDRFVLFRSEDGNAWKKLTEIEGHGNTNEIKNYHYIDVTPLSGVSFYRLSQVDFDGTTEYLGVQRITWFRELLNLVFFPNPFENHIHLSADVSSDEVKVFDVQGRRVTHLLTVDGPQILGTAQLSPGRYIIMLRNKIFRGIKLH